MLLFRGCIVYCIVVKFRVQIDLLDYRIVEFDCY